MSEARVDKWLWAARIYKTRSMAAAACKKGQISMGGAQLKPSRTVKPGDVVCVRKPPVTYSFKVKQAIEKRVGAKLIPDILENVTPPEQYELLEMNRISGFVNRAKGTGRPGAGGVHHAGIPGRPAVRLRPGRRGRRGRRLVRTGIQETSQSVFLPHQPDDVPRTEHAVGLRLL